MNDARDEQVKAVLLEAAKLVERGWCQGRERDFRDGIACYCALGAINASSPLSGDFDPYDYAYDSLAFYIGVNLGEVSEWNDASGRTQAEVVAALRGAAERVGRDQP
jgi:hypothetical protein